MNKLEELLDEFYQEYETSYIDANTHGVIKLLVETMQQDGFLPKVEIDWENLGYE